MEIGHRLIEDVLETAAVAHHVRARIAEARGVPLQARRPPRERLGAHAGELLGGYTRVVVTTRHDGELDLRDRAGGDDELVVRGGPLHVRGRRRERHHALVPGAAQAVVREDDPGLAHARGMRRASPWPSRAAHLEDVGKVGAEGDRHVQHHAALEEVGEDDLLDQPRVEHLTPPDVEEVLRVVEDVAPIEVRQHEVDLVVPVVGRVRGEADHLAAADVERVVRQEARVLVKEAELARAGRRDVAAAIAHQERRALRAHELLHVRRGGEAEGLCAGGGGGQALPARVPCRRRRGVPRAPALAVGPVHVARHGAAPSVGSPWRPLRHPAVITRRPRGCAGGPASRSHRAPSGRGGGRPTRAGA